MLMLDSRWPSEVGDDQNGISGEHDPLDCEP